jgi:hypothetical protein
MNSTGATLDATGMTGVIAVTGNTNYVLKNGTYILDGEKLLIDVLGAKVVQDNSAQWVDYFGPYQTGFEHPELVERFKQLNLCPTAAPGYDRTLNVGSPLSIH